MSKSTKTKSNRSISRAELKAYQMRRADEARRVAAPQVQADIMSSAIVRHAYTLSRDEEFAVIRSDLRRLLKIMAFLTVVLFIAAIFLR